MLLLVFVILCAIANGFVNPPQTPDQLTMEASLTTPFGTYNGKYYFDYPNLRSRVDMKVFGFDSITIALYGINPPTQYVISSGSCEPKPLDEELYPMSVLPFSTFVGVEKVQGHDAEHYTASLASITLDWYVANYTLPSGKEGSYVVQYEQDIGFFKTGFTVLDLVDVGDPGDDIFDVTQFGCPAPDPPVTYDVAGYVKDAVSENVVTSATVTMTGPDGDSTQYTAHSNSEGRYSISDLAEGEYKIDITASGYADAENYILNVSKNIPAGSGADFNLSPNLSTGSFRSVLSWGAQPRDLDLHAIIGGCEVFYNHRTCSSGGMTANLDVDKVYGYGPETITIKSGSSQNIKLFVYLYAGSGTLSSSSGTVSLYGSSGLLKTIDVPSGSSSGRYWYLGDLQSGTFYEKNVIQSSKP